MSEFPDKVADAMRGLSSTARRVLVVIADMTDGDSTKHVSIADITEYANRLGVPGMSDAEFDIYHEDVCHRIALKRLTIGPLPS